MGPVPAPGDDPWQWVALALATGLLGILAAIGKAWAADRADRKAGPPAAPENGEHGWKAERALVLHRMGSLEGDQQKLEAKLDTHKALVEAYRQEIQSLNAELYVIKLHFKDSGQRRRVSDRGDSD